MEDKGMTRIVESSPAPEGHCDFAPSSMARLRACPASYRLSLGIPSVPTESSLMGTAAHAMVAATLLEARGIVSELRDQEVFARASAGIARENEGKPWIQEASDGAWKAVSWLADWLDGIESEGRRYSMWVEKRIEVRDFAQRTVTWGTSDVLVLSGERLYVIDWKFGRKPVPAVDNIQLTCYAIGAVQTLLREGIAKSVPKVSCIIYQPHAGDEPAVWDDVDLSASSDIEKIVRECRSDDPAVRCGDHCRFCPAFRAMCCPLVSEVVRLCPDAVMTLPGESLQDITDQALEALHGTLSLVSDYLSGVEDEIKRRIDASPSHSMGPFRIQAAKGRLSLDNPQALFERIREAFPMVDEGGFLSCGSFSAPKLAKYVSSLYGTKDGRKKAREDAVAEICEAMGTRAADIRKLVRKEG